MLLLITLMGAIFIASLKARLVLKCFWLAYCSMILISDLRFAGLSSSAVHVPLLRGKSCCVHGVSVPYVAEA